MCNEKISYKVIRDIKDSKLMPRTAVITSIMYGEKIISRSVDVKTYRFFNNLIGYACAA